MGCTTCLSLQERVRHSAARRTFSCQRPAAVPAELNSTQLSSQSQVLARQPQTLTEHGGESQAGHLHYRRPSLWDSHCCTGYNLIRSASWSEALPAGFCFSTCPSTNARAASLPQPTPSPLMFHRWYFSSHTPQSIRVSASCGSQTTTHNDTAQR